MAERDPKDIAYFYVGPDGEIYENTENLPAKVLGGFKRFKDHYDPILRFAYDPVANKFYVQDDGTKAMLAARDQDTWDNVNKALRFLAEEYDATYVSTGYGDPPGTSVRRKLSQYQITWNYISRYMRDEFGMEPLDVDVCEFVPEDASQKDMTVVFSPGGGTCRGEEIKGPMFFVNKHMHKAKGRDESELNYGLINHMLVLHYMKNFEAINSQRPSMEQQISFASKWAKHNDDMGYELYAAIMSNDGEVVIGKAPSKAMNRVQNESMIRAKISEQYGDYQGPIVLFAYLPEQKQVVFQNYAPTDMADFEPYDKMLAEIKRTMSSAANVPEKDLVLSYEPSMASPFVSKASRYTVVWDYIQDYMAPRLGFEPQDITIVEMPVPMEGALAAFVKSATDEAEKAPEAKKYRISHGISVQYPFIMVDSRITNLGLKYHAIIHEYAHYVSHVLGLPVIPYSFKGGPDSASSHEERSQRFVEYIRHEDEQRAHFEQMLYMLMMGMQPGDVVDFFARREQLLERAEYRKILSRALEAYNARKKGSQAQQPPQEPTPAEPQQRQAALRKMPGVNDWWQIGLQETINKYRHDNDTSSHAERKKKRQPFNLKRVKDKGKSKHPSYEERLRVHHDKDHSAQKPMEVLLDENRI